MNLLTLLDTIGTAPVGAAASHSPLLERRALLRSAGQAGLRAIATALPLAATLPGVAAPAAETVLDSIRLLLTLADLQAALFSRALAAPSPIDAAIRPDIVRIQLLHQRQATFLRGLFASAGAQVPAVPTFDFSGSHNGTGPVQFADVFATTDGFLRVAQPLADAAARIYLGQLLTMRTNTQLLTPITRRQAVEARVASHLRTLRRGTGTLPKSWPSTTDPAVAAALSVTQTGEATLEQPVPGITSTNTFSGLRLIDFNALFAANPVQTTALTEAFDEPLATEQAMALLAVFQ